MPVTLSAGGIETYTLGGVTVESHVASAIIGINDNFPGKTSVYTFAQGGPSDNTFAPGPRSSTPTISVDLVTGRYVTSTGLTGTLTGAQLTALLNSQRTEKNAIENFANAIGLLPGTVVAYT